MNVLYEEEGEYKAGTVLSQSPASYQVESPHGRRSKIKAASVVFSFERPSAAELLAEARKFADNLDTDFLWQCRKGAEFAFQDLARDYVGHDPAAVESVGVLLKLHSAPMYFYRRGRGRFQAAPEDTLKHALAGVEKKSACRRKSPIGRSGSRASNARPRSRLCAKKCSTRRTAPNPRPRRWNRPARSSV